MRLPTGGRGLASGALDFSKFHAKTFSVNDWRALQNKTSKISAQPCVLTDFELTIHLGANWPRSFMQVSAAACLNATLRRLIAFV
jgi:hypothetical protein